MSDLSGPVRQYALPALARMDRPEAKETARRMATDAYPGVRERAGQILGKA